MIQVIRERCKGCGTCVSACPKGAMFIAEGYADVDENLCNSCGLCIEACPEGAIALAAERVSSREVQPARAVQPPAKPVSREIVSALSRSVLPALGTAIAFAGREILPRIADTWLSARVSGESVGGANDRTVGQAQRLRRRRRGKS